MNAPARALLILVAIGLVVGMGIHYETQSEQHWPYPTGDDLAADYDQQVGQEIFIFGAVTSIDRAADRGTIRVQYDGGQLGMTVRGFDADVRPGGTVQVVGTIEPDHTIDASTIRVVNPAGSSLLFKYGVSLVGALLVTVLFLRDWRIDLRRLAFEVRDDG